MQRIRLAGIIPMGNGFALMHRKDVMKNPDRQEYYVFPGGGREGDETYEKFNQTTIYYLCEYVSGEFGTGTGPEFSNDPKYIDSGKYIPEIVKREDIERIPLMPPEIKEKFLEDIRNKKI